MGPPPTDALIQIREVTKTYRRGSEKIEVLHGIDLDIPAGTSWLSWARPGRARPRCST